jgi:hypothetical protein
MATKQPQVAGNKPTQHAANSGNNTQQAAKWSAEAEAQQHSGVHADTLVPMYQIRSAAEAVVAAGSKKEGAGARWMLLLVEMMAAGDAAEDVNEAAA